VIEEMRIEAGFGPTPVPPPPTPPAWDVRVFSATPEAAELVGTDGPDEELLPRQMVLPPLDGYDFDTLLENATDLEWSSVRHGRPLAPITRGNGFKVVPLRAELAPALAALNESDVVSCGEMWPEDDGWSSLLDEETAIELVRHLHWLAEALEEGEELYLWISETSMNESGENDLQQE
jgi:hypothetical protein